MIIYHRPLIMDVLVACEESQEVCKAFRERGHNAFSCDIEPCSGGYPEWHIQEDVRKVLHYRWDLIIAHPPCTYLCNSGRWRYFHPADREVDPFLKREHPKYPGLQEKFWQAVDFFNIFLSHLTAKVCVEQPIPMNWLLEEVGPYNQIIQPYQFGHDAKKATCLWLRGLPELKPTKIIVRDKYANQTPSGQNNLGPSKDRAKLRSKTYRGIAQAMAAQWG